MCLRLRRFSLQVVNPDFTLDQNYPNPFNPTTTIQFALPRDANVSLKVHNLLGQEVVTILEETKSAGYYKLQWNGRHEYGSSIASGVYFYRIEARPLDGGEAFTSLRKMMMLK